MCGDKAINSVCPKAVAVSPGALEQERSLLAFEPSNLAGNGGRISLYLPPTSKGPQAINSEVTSPDE